MGWRKLGSSYGREERGMGGPLSEQEKVRNKGKDQEVFLPSKGSACL